MVELAQDLARIVSPENLQLVYKVERTLSCSDVIGVFHSLGYRPGLALPKAQSYLVAVLPAPNSKDSMLVDFTGLCVKGEERERESGVISLASSDFEEVGEEEGSRLEEDFDTPQHSMEEQNNLVSTSWGSYIFPS